VPAQRPRPRPYYNVRMGMKAATKLGHVLLLEEANPLRAHLVSGALEEAGIPCVVEDDNLADEFSMVRKLGGMQGTRVWVPIARADEAQVIFLGMSQPIPIIDEDDPELEALGRSYASRQKRALGWIIMAWLVLPVIALALYWLSDRFGWFS